MGEGEDGGDAEVRRLWTWVGDTGLRGRSLWGGVREEWEMRVRSG